MKEPAFPEANKGLAMVQQVVPCLEQLRVVGTSRVLIVDVEAPVVFTDGGM